jgi:hypothetical protein
MLVISHHHKERKIFSQLNLVKSKKKTLSCHKTKLENDQKFIKGNYSERGAYY